MTKFRFTIAISLWAATYHYFTTITRLKIKSYGRMATSQAVHVSIEKMLPRYEYRPRVFLEFWPTCMSPRVDRRMIDVDHQSSLYISSGKSGQNA